MGAVDVIMKKLTQTVLLPGFIAGFLLYKSMPILTKTYKIVYAWIVNKVAAKYNKKLGKRKQKLFADLHDTAAEMATEGRKIKILEIGAGAGANFKFYPDGSQIICVDPNPYFESYLKRHVAEFPHVTLDHFIISRAEDMNTVPTESVDAVVCTLVLCTVNNLQQVLGEVHRVLRNGGKFYYMEHVAAPVGSWKRKFQEFLQPVWKFLADNCHLARQTGKLIKETGFDDVDHNHFNAPLIGLLSPHLSGIATK